MVKYRRYYIPGGTYFFTVALNDRRSCMLTTHIKQLGMALRAAKQMHPFKTLAMVVLPDHLHAMWELPEGDSDFSWRWSYIKLAFVKNLKKDGINISKNHYQEHELWQRRFWEHTIRDDRDYEKHVDYIHYNPVKHGLVKKVVDWPHSTFHRYVKEKILPRNWSSYGDNLYGEFGFLEGDK